MAQEVDTQINLKTVEDLPPRKRIKRKKSIQSKKGERCQSEMSNYSSSEIPIAPANNKVNMRGNELNSIERTLSPENKENKYIMNSIDRHGSSVNECSEISNTINLENQKNMTLCRSNSQIIKRPRSSSKDKKSANVLKAIESKNIGNVDPQSNKAIMEIIEKSKNVNERFYVRAEDHNNISNQISDYISNNDK